MYIVSTCSLPDPANTLDIRGTIPSAREVEGAQDQRQRQGEAFGKRRSLKRDLRRCRDFNEMFMGFYVILQDLCGF